MDYLYRIIKNIIKIKKHINRKYFADEINKDLLISDFKKFGIEPGISLFVHSSLSQIGNIKGGANTVVDSLIKVVGQDGTIMMPGFTISNSMEESLEILQKNDITFNYKTEKPLTGAIPRSFFKVKNVLRSIHPTHSVLAWGKNAEYITSDHENCDTTFGKGTPLYKLIETDSYIMGLGSGIGYVTFYHVIEDVIKDFPIEVYGRKEYKIKLLIDNKTRFLSLKFHKKQYVRIERINGTWARTFIKNYFKQVGKLMEGRIGDANCWIIKASDMYDCLEKLMNAGITIYSPAPNYFYKIYFSVRGLMEKLNR